jgi:GT2 family glycosyltransferase
MHSEVSLVIKTFERPAALERLLASILASPAAGCPILIADDSWKANASATLARTNIAYFRLPSDSGLSQGRNYLVDRVATPYCVLLDDDFVFVPETDLAILLDIVRNRGFDLAAGAVRGIGRPCHANIDVAGRDLFVTRGAPPRTLHNGLPVYDLVDNFFLAKTDTLREVRWDDRFKIYGEHLDFFYRYSTRHRSTFTDRVVVGHEQGGYSLRGGLGKHWPGRRLRSSRIFGRKHGIDRVNGRPLSGIRAALDFYLPALGSRVRTTGSAR